VQKIVQMIDSQTLRGEGDMTTFVNWLPGIFFPVYTYRIVILVVRFERYAWYDMFSFACSFRCCEHKFDPPVRRLSW